MNIKLVALDLDGTILSDFKTIAPRVKTAISRAQAKGVKVIFATGRVYANMKQFFDEGDFSQTWHITCNGSVIIDSQGRIFNKTMLDKGAFDEMALFLEEQNIPFAAYSELEMYRSKAAKAASLYDDCRDAENLHALPFISKALVGPAFGLGLDKKLASLNLSHAKSVYKGETYYEIWPAGLHKGTAVLQVAAQYGIKAEEILAIGDSGNDVGMLKSAGLGVAMGQGQADAKAAANIIAPSIDEDGAAWAIEKYILKEHS